MSGKEKEPTESGPANPPPTTDPPPTVEQQIAQLTEQMTKHEKLITEVEDDYVEHAAPLTNKAPEVSDPIKYDCKPEKLDQFLNQLDNHFVFYPERFRNDERKILFVGMYLEGPALNTYPAVKNHYYTTDIATEQKNPKIIQTMTVFEEFVRLLQDLSGYKSKKFHAQQKLDSLHQTGSARSYFQEFNQYAMLAEYNEEYLYHKAREGLKTNIKIEILKEEERNGLNRMQLQALAIRIDDALYQGRKTEFKGNREFPKHHQKYQNPNRDWKQQNGRYIPNRTYGPSKMDLGATQHRETFRKNTQKLRTTVPICYYCNKKGHYKKECRKKEYDEKRRAEKGK